MKLIAVDLDGTLLNHSKEVLESSRQAIAAAAAAGVQVVVASGRSFPEAQRFVAGTACSEHVICAGGAAIVNRTSGVSRHTWYLDCQTAARVHLSLRSMTNFSLHSSSNVTLLLPAI